MAIASCFPLYKPAVTSTNSFIHNHLLFTKGAPPSSSGRGSVRCKAGSSSTSLTEFDLYDLLGIDSSSNQNEIKLAYRSLQKKCHPDIAGLPGHDMAIILNQAYSLLSDPISRMAYDKEQAKFAELKGYTGRALYSVWLGSESEERAVFVDEVKCVGCLKCALFADKTFAIESVYGRARVIAQWADPEYKIQQAIEICPVNCISMVERSDLPALEFLMSKQPRGRVRVGGGNTVGERVANIFVDVKKFQNRYGDAMNKGPTRTSEETDHKRESMISSIQAIRSISNWLYWQSNAAIPKSESLIHIPRKQPLPDIEKLRAAAAARKNAESTNIKPKTPTTNHDEYWFPTIHTLPSSAQNKKVDSKESVKATQKKHTSDSRIDKGYKASERNWRNPIFEWGVAAIGATIIRLQVGGEQGVGRLNEHIGGSTALEIVNSSWLQTMLAAVTWYFIAVVVVELVEGIRKK